MKRFAAFAVTGVLLLPSFGCATTAGTGGDTSCDINDWAFPECCSVPDHRPCRGFGKVACEATYYCEAVYGTPWEDHHVATHYLGCRSRCGTWDPASLGLYDPANPAVCYWDATGFIPDGWVEFEESHPLPGTCGQ
jgi:hypothetical protein